MKSYWEELRFEAIRSRGPGGQNVNKVSSAALLSWDFEASLYFTPEQKALIRERLASFINKEGILFLRSDEFRDLPRNKEKCREKLEALLVKAFFKPKARKATQQSYSSKLRDKKSKQVRSKTKQGRQKKWSID